MDYKNPIVGEKNYDKYNQYFLIKINGNLKINVTFKIHSEFCTQQWSTLIKKTSLNNI